MANQITVNSGTGNITVTTSRSVIGTVANVASANVANYAANVTGNAQPNITSVGNLTGLTVNGTTTTGNLVVTGNLQVGNLVANNANYANFAGQANTANTANVANIATTAVVATTVPGSGVNGNVGSALVAYSVGGANVTGTVANATYAVSAGTANSATVANSANSVALANVSGAGNIASINLDGSSSNVLYGNGVFAPAAGGNTANANYANFAGTAFSVAGANVTGTVPNANVSNFSNVVLAANYTGRLAIVNSSGNSEIYRMANVIVTEASGNASIQMGSTSIGTIGIIGNGAGLTNITGANVTGTVANATYAANAGNANIANTAYSVSLANVSGAGNIASINLTGSSSNVLYGNGVFAPAGGSGANANYANFAGDVVNSTQSNITSVGNLVSLQVGNGSANTATTTFTPVGANITTLAGDIFVNNKRVSYDDGDAMANGAMAQDAIVVPFDSANGFGETYQVNYLIQDLANTSNVALSTNMSYNPGQYVPGDSAASGSYIFQTYTDDSDLATANPNTTLDVTLGGLGLFINPKMPNQNNGPAQTGIIGMMNYGEVSDPSSATSIVLQRRRGNNSSGPSTRAPVQANDYLGNIVWRGAGSATGSINSQRAVVGAKVDSTYGGPGNVMPIGMEMVVVNNSNAQLTHSFYANGDVSFAGNVTATGNISTSRISNGTSNVRVSTTNGPVRIATNGTTWVEYGTNRSLTLSGVEADYANATTLQLRNGGINVIQEDLQGGFPSFAFSSYYPNTGFIAPYTFYRARGNATSPAAVQGGDAVTTQSYYVYGDSGNTYVNIGTYSATVANNDGAGNIQSRIEISTARIDNGSEVKFNSDSITLQGNTIINLNANDSNVSGNLNVTGNITYSRTFGAFYNPNAIAITANTASNLALPNVANNNNVVINSSNQITINKSGTYNIQISLQLTNSDNANEHDFDVWFAKNGTDIAYSATQYTVPKNNGKAVASLNFIDGNITAGDYFQVRYAATSANVSIEAFAAQSTPYVRPAVPSAIVTVVPVGA